MSDVFKLALQSAIEALEKRDDWQHTVEIGERDGTWKITGTMGEARLDAYVNEDGDIGARIIRTAPWPLESIDDPPTTFDENGKPLWVREEEAHPRIIFFLDETGDDWERKASFNIFAVLRNVYLNMGQI